MTCRRCVVGVSVLMVAFSVAFLSCGPKEKPAGPGGQGGLTILIPASLAAPMEGVAAEFEKLYPAVKVQREIAGGLDAVRMITEQGKKADVFASSDYAVIATMLMPKSASWYIRFARNYIQVAFTEKSKFSDKINSSNWYEYYAQSGVKVGGVDPDADPLGYRTLMVMQLTESHYMKKGLAGDLRKNCLAPFQPEAKPGTRVGTGLAKSIRTDGAEVVKMLQAGELDYAWLYRSVIKQNGLKYIALPPEVDLSSGSFEDKYKQAKVEIAGATPGSKRTILGEPIIYGVTIPNDAPNKEAALNFVKVMLGPAGQQVFDKNAQKQLVPCEASDKTKVPAELATLCK